MIVIKRKILLHDRYEVKKISDTEGPTLISKSAEFMKRYYNGLSDDDNDDDSNVNVTESDFTLDQSTNKLHDSTKVGGSAINGQQEQNLQDYTLPSSRDCNDFLGF